MIRALALGGEMQDLARIWSVAALVRAFSDTLSARFNPVEVKGEITNFTRASSGHCYFSLKDDGAQLRCAMFRRAAALVNFDLRFILPSRICCKIVEYISSVCRNIYSN